MRRNIVSMLVISVLLSLIINGSGSPAIQEEPKGEQNTPLDTIEILFIGSSYFNYNNLPSLFENLAVESGKTVYIDQRIQNGLYLSNHAESPETEQKINERDWEYVILQGCGINMAYPNYFTDHPAYPALVTLQEKIYANCETSKMVFCMPWAFEDGMTWFEDWTDTFADMQELIYENTLQYAEEIGFIIAPVGWAWYTVLEDLEYPLHYLHMSDWNHPTLKGSYLMACVIFSTVFIESTLEIEYYAEIPEEEAIYFQTVASDIVLTNLSLWNIPYDSTIYVDDDNTQGPWEGTQQYPYQHIQDGINRASSGDTISINTGIYYEPIIINKTLTIIGQQTETTIIDGGYCFHTVTITVPSVILRNITILNGAYALFMISNDNQISGIIMQSGQGICLQGSADNLIYNNVFNNTGSNYYDDLGASRWNISKTPGVNILGGSYLGGNYWNDYAGEDVDGDGLGDTELPYGPGDFLPLVPQESLLDVEQLIHDRGFPIRHALDGNWAGAQSVMPTVSTMTSIELYLRRFGTPEFNLTVELRTDHPQGTIVDTLIFSPDEVPTSWEWVTMDFTDTSIIPGMEYFIVCPPAPNGVSTSFGYEWGYAFGNQYDEGAFWFTRDGGGLWRDLPAMYEFCFRTYGYNRPINFTVDAKYSYIMSYCDGGGIFPVYLDEYCSSVGDIFLSIEANESLHTQLSAPLLNNTIRNMELTICPDNTTNLGNHTIELIASNGEITNSIFLKVEMVNWPYYPPDSYIVGKRNAFIDWIADEYPEIGDLSDQEWFAYETYPFIWIVSHWTFLSSEWEFRVCCHNTIPPHNWSKMCLRKLCNIDPICAAHQEYNGATYEIPIDEYPTFYGY